MSRNLASIIVRQYPPRRDALWNPGAFKRARTSRYARFSGPALAHSREAITAPLSLAQKAWANEDVRHFGMTFSGAFIALMIFFG